MTGTLFPFEVAELGDADARVAALFYKSFRSTAPDFPRHFVAFRTSSHNSIAGYVHFTTYEPGVFLLGGLCVDSSTYRRLTTIERALVAAEGSLARWLMKRSIERLVAVRAVFGYTGDARSRRDATALGFVQAAEPFLIVQWHQQPQPTRAALVAAIDALGPF
jgi:hypothetical protein